MKQKSNRYYAMMETFKVIYPILIYFVVMIVAMDIFTVILVNLGGDYKKQYMLLQTLVSVVTIPFVYHFYREDRKKPTVFHQHLAENLGQKETGKRIGNGILMFLAGASAGIAMNNIIAMTGLKESSGAFQEVTENFFAGSIFMEILGTCLITPILEEMLYRSVVYGRISDLMIFKAKAETPEQEKKDRRNRSYAMFFTALLFGAMHMNVVQFIYATVLGIMLAWFVEESGHLYGAVAAHIGANLISVLRTETGMFDWVMKSRGIFIGETVGFCILSVILIAVIWKYNEKCLTNIKKA